MSLTWGTLYIDIKKAPILWYNKVTTTIKTKLRKVLTL